MVDGDKIDDLGVPIKRKIPEATETDDLGVPKKKILDTTSINSESPLSSASTENPSDSEIPSIGKIKHENSKNIELGNSTVLKDRMKTALSENKSPAYEKAFIDTLAKKGYNKEQLEQFADTINPPKKIKLPSGEEIEVAKREQPKRETPLEETSISDLATNTGMPSGIVKSGLDYIDKSAEGIEQGSKQAYKAFQHLSDNIGTKGMLSGKPITTKLKEVGTDALNMAAGTIKSGFSGGGIVVPELATFNLATEAATKLPDKAKAAIMMGITHQGLSTEQSAKDFDKTIELPFTLATTLAESAGMDLKEGSAQKAIAEILNILPALALGKIGEKESSIKNADDLKEIAQKIADNKATPEEIKNYAEISNAMKDVSVQEVKSAMSDKASQIPVKDDELHTKAAELEQKINSPEIQNLPDDNPIKSGLINDRKQIVNEIIDKNKEEINQHTDEAEHEAVKADLQSKIEEAEASLEGQSEPVKESIQKTIINLKQQQDALSKQSPGSLLQRPQEGVGEQRSERQRMEPIEQGIETSRPQEETTGNEKSQETPVAETSGEIKNEPLSSEKEKYVNDKIQEHINENINQGTKSEANASDQTNPKPEGETKYQEEVIQPEESPKEERERIKITHEAIEKDRKEMGLPPIEKEPSDIKQDFIDAHKEFQSANKLAQTSIESQRPLTRKEVYILGLRQVKLKSEARAIREQIINANNKNSDELKIQLILTETELDNNGRAIKNVSSEAGKSLQAFQTAFAEDTSLEGTLLSARAYTKNGKLTAKQEKEFYEISDRLEKAEKKLAEYENNKSKKDAQKIINKLISEPKQKKNILNRTKEERLSKIDELKEKWKTLNNDKNRPVQQGLGLSDEHIKIIVELGAEYIGLGVTEFKTWAKKIKADLGTIDDDELNELWNNESSEGVKLKDFAKEIEKNKTINISESEGKIKNIHAKIKNLVVNGITDIDAIVTEIKKELPNMSDREIRDEISGYGKTSEYSQDPINKQIREIKRIGGLISALEDARKGESPQKKGLQRDEPSTKEVQLRKQVNEAMRENQLKIENEPKTPEQWKTALDRYKKRLKNKYEELVDKKEKGDYEIKKKYALELDSEALQLKRNVDKEKGIRKRELEKIRLDNRNKFEKFADYTIKAMRFMALAGFQKPIIKLGIAGAIKGYIQNPVNTLIAGIYSKIPGIRNIYKQSPRWRSEGATKALAKGIAEAWSKKTFKDIVEQIKGGKRADEIQFDTDKGHLPPSLWEAWNVEHKILKTPLMNAEFRTSMDKNLQYLNEKGMNIADPVTINLAAARATQDALRAVYLNKSPLVSGYQAAIKIMGADTKDGSFGGKVVSKIVEGDNLIIKVPTNFITEQIESTPLGFIQAVATKDFINIIKGKVNNLSPDIADRLARKLNNATAGTVALAIGGLLYLNHFGGNKYIKQQQSSLSGQKDKMKEGDMNLLGINIPHYMQHFSFAQSLQMGAGIARVMDYYDTIDRKHYTKENHLIKGIWEAAGSTISKIPFVSSAVEGGEALNNSYNAEKLMGRFIDNVMLLPGKAASLIDSKDRKAITPLEHIKKNIPGLRENLPIKLSKAAEQLKKEFLKMAKE